MVASAAVPINESAYQCKPVTQARADAIRADFLMKVHRTEETKALLDQVLKVDPNSAQAHLTMGYLALHDGDYEAACKVCGEAVTPDSH